MLLINHYLERSQIKKRDNIPKIRLIDEEQKPYIEGFEFKCLMMQNRQKHNKRMKEWCKKNPEKRKASTSLYRQKNREKINKKQRQETATMTKEERSQRYEQEKNRRIEKYGIEVYKQKEKERRQRYLLSKKQREAH